MTESLFVEEIPGEGPPLVFLHGLGATHRYWHTGLAGLRLRAHVVLVDLLGFGDSPKPWCRYTIDRHLAPLHAALERFEEMTLVGHSLGAALALAYAARFPHAVRRLVLLSLPYFGDQANAYRWFRRRPSGWLLTNMAATALACILSRWVAARLLPFLIRGYPREVVEDLVKHHVLSSTTSLWEVLYRHDFRACADALPGTVEVYLLHGTADATAPAEGIERLAAGRASWSVELLPGVDHHPWLRQPEACRALLARAMGASRCGSEPPVRAQSCL